jgi:hypothetical protein
LADDREDKGRKDRHHGRLTPRLTKQKRGGRHQAAKPELRCWLAECGHWPSAKHSGNLNSGWDQGFEAGNARRILAVFQGVFEIVDIYTELFEELPDPALHQEMLTEVREGGWLPKTATEFVERFILRTTGTATS